jgi:hypothetical protein
MRWRTIAVLEGELTRLVNEMSEKGFVVVCEGRDESGRSYRSSTVRDGFTDELTCVTRNLARELDLADRFKLWTATFDRDVWHVEEAGEYAAHWDGVAKSVEPMRQLAVRMLAAMKASRPPPKAASAAQDLSTAFRSMQDGMRLQDSGQEPASASSSAAHSVA